MDNFNILEDSFTITLENKEQVFSEMLDKFNSTAKQLKLDNMQSEEQFLKYRKKYWGKRDTAKDKKEYAKEKKEYLSTIK